MQIFNLIHGVYWGGSASEIVDGMPIPPGWTAAVPIQPVPEGQYNRLVDALTFELTTVAPSPASTPSAPVRIDTPLFIMRFTPEERVAMRQAAKSDTEYAPLIDDWLMILNDPRLAYVELGDPNLITAMGMMVQLGLLTQERADIVMAP